MFLVQQLDKNQRNRIQTKNEIKKVTYGTI